MARFPRCDLSDCPRVPFPPLVRPTITKHTKFPCCWNFSLLEFISSPKQGETEEGSLGIHPAHARKEKGKGNLACGGSSAWLGGVWTWVDGDRAVSQGHRSMLLISMGCSPVSHPLCQGGKEPFFSSCILSPVQISSCRLGMFPQAGPQGQNCKSSVKLMSGQAAVAISTLIFVLHIKLGF